MSTRNTYGTVRKKWGGSIPIWLGRQVPKAIGGTLAAAYVKQGAFYPAGTPLNETKRVLTPFLVYLVTAVDSDEYTLLAPGYVPKVGDKLQLITDSWAGRRDALTVTSVVKGADNTCVIGATAITESVPKAASSVQTAGQAIVGTVYESVEAGTAGAVKCALVDKTVVYLNSEAATGTAVEGKSYYTKDTADPVVLDGPEVAANAVLIEKSALVPNGYLGHDIDLGELDVAEGVYASGDIVVMHRDGILIDRTPGGFIKSLMLEAVPHVVQVEEDIDA